MDVVLPGHSIRLFCASLVCASKIGKDLYLEFDVTNGLTLRTLNDAKSAYVCFRFLPHLFQRCTAPLSNMESHRHHHHENHRRQHNRRKRSRDANDDHASESPSNSTQQSSPANSLDSQLSDKFVCRVSLRALTPLVRPRKNELFLRIKSEYKSNNRDTQDDTDAPGSTLCLSFEFQWQASTSDQAPLLKVVHTIPVAPVPHASAAVARRQGASELEAHPSVLVRLLDPLKRTAEAALIVRSDLQRIHASSFHQSSSSVNNNDTNNNAVLQSNADSLVKTETGIACDDLTEFFFREDRDEDDDEQDMPPNVNQHVILVFPIKEAKAFLQFANSQQIHQHAQEEASCKLFFHWGGKPILWQIQQPLSPTAVLGTDQLSSAAWRAELILATLNHSLLGTTGMDGVAGNQSRSINSSSNHGHRRVST